MHERGFPGSRRAGDGKKFAPLDIQVDPAQRLYLHLADHVRLDQVLDRNHDGRRHHPSVPDRLHPGRPIPSPAPPPSVLPRFLTEIPMDVDTPLASPPASTRAAKSPRPSETTGAPAT